MKAYAEMFTNTWNDREANIKRRKSRPFDTRRRKKREIEIGTVDRLPRCASGGISKSSSGICSHTHKLGVLINYTQLINF